MAVCEKERKTKPLFFLGGGLSGTGKKLPGVSMGGRGGVEGYDPLWGRGSGPTSGRICSSQMRRLWIPSSFRRDPCCF